MIIDKRARGQGTGDRGQRAGSQRQHSLLVTRHSSLVTLRRPWVRLLLLTLAVVALSVIGAIVGELVSAEKGLGFLLQLGDFQYDTPRVFVAVFTLVALALMLYGVVTLLEKRFLKWQNPSS